MNHMSDNTHSSQHEMRLEKTHPSGAEEWHCPTCGRRFVIQWPPVFKRIVLEAGDEYASHSGGKGGVQILAAQIDESEDPQLSDELRSALNDLLENIDLDD